MNQFSCNYCGIQKTKGTLGQFLSQRTLPLSREIGLSLVNCDSSYGPRSLLCPVHSGDPLHHKEIWQSRGLLIFWYFPLLTPSVCVNLFKFYLLYKSLEFSLCLVVVPIQSYRFKTTPATSNVDFYRKQVSDNNHCKDPNIIP